MKNIILVFTMLIPAMLFGVDGNNQDDNEHSIFTMSLLPTQIEFNPLYSYSSLEGQIYSALFEGLVSHDPQSLRPVPAMAERWEILDNGLLYRFHIHPQAYYSNGDKVLSSHFMNAWFKMLDLGNEAPFGFLLDPILNASEYRRGEILNKEDVGISIPEDDVLEVRLEYPISHFLSILAHQSLVAIHPDILNIRNWNQLSSLLGSGPYRIMERNTEKIEFIRNEKYWDSEHSKFDQLVLLFSDDSTGITQRFNSGEIQWIYNGFSSPELKSRDSLQINPQFSTSYYFFSSNQEPFNDERIRRALLLLLPLGTIRSEEVHFFPSSVLIPQIPGYPEVEGLVDTDNDSALTLLNEAGYPAGKGLPPLRITLTDSTEARRVATIMKDTWEDTLNVSVELFFEDYFEYQNTLKKKNFTIGSLSWIGDYADPMTFLQLWQSDSTLNTADYADAQFDTLLQESNGLQGLPRYERLAKAEEYLLKSAILLPVSHSPSFHVINLTLIGGWHPNPLDVHPFKYIHKNKLRPPPNIAVLGSR